MKKYKFSFFFTFLFFLKIFSQNPFPDNGELFRDDIVPRIDITINPDSLKLIIDKTDIWSDHEYIADFVFDNSTVRDTLKSIGFRLRGNTSRFSQKKSFKVSFNTYEKGRKYYGVEKLNLNGEHNDPSIVRTKLCCDLAKEMGIIASRANHIKLFINGVYFGLYINVEHVDEEFVKSRFGNNNGNLYKCTYPADLNFKSNNPDLYKFENNGTRVYELKINEDTDDYSDLADLIYKINFTIASNFGCELDKIFNIDEYIKIMVFDILTGNWDGYAYNKNNFYLYHNTKTGKFEYILYDMDNTFGIDWFNTDWSARNIYSWSKSNEKRPLFTGILNNPVFKSIFTMQMKKSLDSVFIPSKINDYLNKKRELIRVDAAADIYRTKDYGFTYSDFFNSYDKKINYNHVSFGIKDFISRRYFYAFSQINTNFYLPVISGYNPISSQGSVYFTAMIGNPALLSNIKLLHDSENAGTFTTLNMNDNGSYPDKSAGDNIFTSPAISYNGNFKYYFSLTDLNGVTNNFPYCNPQEFSVEEEGHKLAINEFMASNDNTIKDEKGDFDDWIEIYNYGNKDIFLGNFYITDNQSVPQKWKLPEIYLGANKFTLLWADDETEQGNNHLNFKLSAGGEYIGIFDSDGKNVDGYYFSEQLTDQSEGRIPDGTGTFMKVFPTPGHENKPLGYESSFEECGISIFPNPASTTITLDIGGLELDKKSIVRICNSKGIVMINKEITATNPLTVDISELQEGMYYIMMNLKSNNFIKKICILK